MLGVHVTLFFSQHVDGIMKTQMYRTVICCGNSVQILHKINVTNTPFFVCSLSTCTHGHIKLSVYIRAAVKVHEASTVLQYAFKGGQVDCEPLLAGVGTKRILCKDYSEAALKLVHKSWRDAVFYRKYKLVVLMRHTL